MASLDLEESSIAILLLLFESRDDFGLLEQRLLRDLRFLTDLSLPLRSLFFRQVGAVALPLRIALLTKTLPLEDLFVIYDRFFNHFFFFLF